MHLEQGDGVAKLCRPLSQLVVERQPRSSDGVAEMVRRIAGPQQVDKLPIMGGRNHDVRGGGGLVLVVAEQFEEHGLAGGDTFDGTRSTEQLIKQEQMWEPAPITVDEREDRLHLVAVAARAGHQVVTPPDDTAHRQDRRVVDRRHTGIDGLGQYYVHTNRPDALTNAVFEPDVGIVRGR